MSVLQSASGTESLADLPRLIEGAEGWPGLIAALAARQSGTIDGAWNSSAALAASTLSLRVPKTLLVVLAHPGDIDPWGHDLFSFAGQKPTLFPGWESWPPE